MEVSKQVQKFQDFIELFYYKELLEAFRQQKSSLAFDFSLLAKQEPDLAEELLDLPEEVIRAFEIAVAHFDVQSKNKNFKVRFFNLPKSSNLPISVVRSKHLGKFIQTFGIIKQKSDVRPQVTNSRFECPACGNIIPLLQLDEKFHEPAKCLGCGRKGKFKLLDKELVDAQRIVLEEAPDDLDGGEQPRRVNIFLKTDLVSPISERRTNPGARVKVTGWLKEIPIVLATGGRSTRYDLMLETNHVQIVEEDFSQIKISDEELEQISTLSKDEFVFDKFVSSVAPSIYGHDKIKEALILQMFGGIKKKEVMVLLRVVIFMFYLLGILELENVLVEIHLLSFHLVKSLIFNL